MSWLNDWERQKEEREDELAAIRAKWCLTHDRSWFRCRDTEPDPGACRVNVADAR